MVNKKNEWSELSLRLGEVPLKEVLKELTRWIEDKAQETPFEKGRIGRLRLEWDFRIAGHLAHIALESTISSKEVEIG